MSNLETWSDFVSNRPTDWSIHLLGNLFAHRKEKGHDGLGLLAVTGNGGVVMRDTLDRRDTSNADKSKYLRVCIGDIAYNTMRMWQGVSGLSRYEGLVSPAYTVCSSRKELIESEFAQHLFKLPLLITQFHRYSQGLVDDTLNLKFHHFSEINVVLPPLTEQQKIASILTSVDEVIEKTQSQINKLQDLKKGTMNELLTRGIGHTEFKDSPVGRIPVGWEVNILGKKVSLIPGHAFKSDSFTSDGASLIRMGNLYNNELDLTRNSVYLPMSFLEGYPKLVITEGNLLMSMTGTVGKEDYGFVVKVPINTPRTLLNQRVAKIVPSNDVDEGFIMHLMRSRVFLNQIYSIGSGTKQANLSSNQILTTVLVFPLLQEQQQIASILSSIDNNIEEKQRKLQQTQSLKKSLMQDLLTGNVRVTVH